MPASDPVRLGESNMFDALQGENDSKQMDARGSMKDDIKQQAFELKNQMKAKGAQLKEQVVQAVDQGKALVNDKVNKSSKSSKPIEQEGNPEEGEWQTVHRKGGEKAKKNMTSEVDATIEQAQQAGRQLKKKGAKVQQQASSILKSSPMLQNGIRQGRAFIRKNNLSVPVMVLLGCIGLYFSLSMIHWMTTPSRTWTEQKMDQGKEAYEALKSLESLRELKEKAGDNMHDWNARYQSLKDDLISRAEHWTAPSRPLTWSESLSDTLDSWRRTLTGQPQLTHFEKIQMHLKDQYADLKGNAASSLLHAGSKITGAGATLNGIKDSILSSGDRLKDSVLPEPSLLDKIKSHLPGQPSTAEQLKAQALNLKLQAEAQAAAMNPGMGKLGREAEYIKNRAVHGAEKAMHQAQDAAQELMDKAKRHMP